MNTETLMEELRAKFGTADLARVEECLRIFNGEIEPEILHDDQEPTRLFFPEIAARPWFDTLQMPWVPEMESRFDKVLAEFKALRDEDARFSPYEDPHTKELGWAGWGTYSIYRSGVVSPEAAERCPATLSALDRTPRGPREGMFTRLQPGTHITPHSGGVNIFLTCHLGLDIPPDCSISVGGDERTWSPGKVLVFDDSFMHEAINKSEVERAVLLWDIWHPELTATEIAALEMLIPHFEAALAAGV